MIEMEFQCSLHHLLVLSIYHKLTDSCSAMRLAAEAQHAQIKIGK